MVDHYDSYTWNLVHLVAAVTGVLPDVVQHDQVRDTHDYTHVVLSPGPGHPDDRHFFSSGRDILQRARVPVLGVCLGMQGLVTTYGGQVRREAPAHGEVSSIRHDGSGVFRGLPQDFAAVRYHSLAAVELPDCLVGTASTGDPPVLMGVRHVSLPLEGVQFHPESVLSEHGVALIANFLR